MFICNLWHAVHTCRYFITLFFGPFVLVCCLISAQYPYPGSQHPWDTLTLSHILSSLFPYLLSTHLHTTFYGLSLSLSSLLLSPPTSLQSFSNPQHYLWSLLISAGLRFHVGKAFREKVSGSIKLIRLDLTTLLQSFTFSFYKSTPSWIFISFYFIFSSFYMSLVLPFHLS